MTLHTLEKYGYSFTLQVISSLLTHKEFLVNIHDILSEEEFSNQAQKWIIKEILKYYDKYHTTISMDILKVELQKIGNEVLQVSIKEQLKEAYKASDDDLQYVQEEFSTFCKNQQLKKALLKSVDLLKAGDYDSIKFMVEAAMKAGQDKNLGHEYIKDIESRYREDHRVTIPTPWQEINDLIQGGLGNGDFGLVYGNPGGGKSWLLIALGGHAVRLGFNVVHYTLELGESYIGRRYDAFFSGVSVDNVTKNREKIEGMIEQLPGKLVIKEYAPNRATISTLESHISKMTELGTAPDLVIIDYVDLLGTKKKTSDRKGEIDDIYLNTKGLAKTLNIPIWSASQVNRAGAKDNVIEGDKSAGSYDKMMITDFAMSLSRKKEDKINNTGRTHIMKNRYGMDGITYRMDADTSNGHFKIRNEYTGPDTDEEQRYAKKAVKDDMGVDGFDRDKLHKEFFKLNN